MKRIIKMLLILVLIIIIVFFSVKYLIPVIQGYAIYESPPPVMIEKGSAIETANYIIFIDDENISYAKNGSTGEIALQSSNASYVINSVLSALPSNGGKVFIKGGTYILTAPVLDNSKSDVILKGEGNSTILKINDSTNISAIKFATGTKRWTIKDLQIDCNGANNVYDNDATNQNAISIAGTSGDPSTDITIDNLYMKDSVSVLIWSTRTLRLTVKDSVFEDGDRGGFRAEPYTNNSDFIGNTFKNGGSAGGDLPAVLIFNGGNNTFAYNKIINSSSWGLSFYTDVDSSKIIGNSFIGNEEYGVYVRVGNDYNIISNNIAYGNALDGIAAWGNYTTITNNIVYDNGFDGIEVGEGYFITVSHNIAYNNGNDGIESSRSNYSTFTDNLVYQNKRHGMTIWGNVSHTIVANNVCIDNNRDNDSDGCGIHLSAAWNVTIRDNYCFDTRSSGSRTQRAGINIVSGCDGLIVEDNWVTPNRDFTINQQGSNIQLNNNMGYTTENSGSQIVADNENIAHGLVGTPTVVTLTSANATYDEEPVIVSAASVDSTNVTAGVYFANGTAITDDVILVYWYAEV